MRQAGDIAGVVRLSGGQRHIDVLLGADLGSLAGEQEAEEFLDNRVPFAVRRLVVVQVHEAGERPGSVAHVLIGRGNDSAVVQLDGQNLHVLIDIRDAGVGDAGRVFLDQLGLIKDLLVKVHILAERALRREEVGAGIAVLLVQAADADELFKTVPVGDGIAGNRLVGPFAGQAQIAPLLGRLAAAVISRGEDILDVLHADGLNRVILVDHEAHRIQPAEVVVAAALHGDNGHRIAERRFKVRILVRARLAGNHNQINRAVNELRRTGAADIRLGQVDVRVGIVLVERIHVIMRDVRENVRALHDDGAGQLVGGILRHEIDHRFVNNGLSAGRFGLRTADVLAIRVQIGGLRNNLRGRHVGPQGNAVVGDCGHGHACRDGHSTEDTELLLHVVKHLFLCFCWLYDTADGLRYRYSFVHFSSIFGKYLFTFELFADFRAVFHAVGTKNSVKNGLFVNRQIPSGRALGQCAVKSVIVLFIYACYTAFERSWILCPTLNPFPMCSIQRFI